MALLHSYCRGENEIMPLLCYLLYLRVLTPPPCPCKPLLVTRELSLGKIHSFLHLF